MNTPPNIDKNDIQQARENEEPEEAIRPMPVLAAAVAAAMVLFGVVYILMYEPLGNSALGDQRSRSELAGKPAPPAGAAIDGGALFAAQCAACHQASGQGLPGVFPPLDGSEWVHGSTRVLANILLHGITGPITVKGQAYEGAMPSFAHLSDAELAAVAGHIRSSWSNQAKDGIDAALFAKERAAGSARTTPFESGDALHALEKE